MEQEGKREVKIQIHLDETTAQGLYCNLGAINHREGEFILDFIYLQPQEAKGKVRSRVILNAVNAKRVFLALQENIRRYEEKFGAIQVSKPPSEKIGFVH